MSEQWAFMPEHKLFGEETYPEEMERYVRPFVAETVREHEVTGYDGAVTLSAYTAVPDAPKGFVMIFHGYCEFFGRYHELMYLLYRAGYGVCFHEHRGHGHSTHENTVPDLVYVKSFSQYVLDARRVYAEVFRPMSEGGPRFLFAHSMGGAVGAMYLESFPEDFDRAMLNAPMLSIGFGTTPAFLAKGLALVRCATGHAMDAAPGQQPFSASPAEVSSPIQSAARHTYQYEMRKADPAYQTNGATFGWLKAAISGMGKAVDRADRIRTKTLLLQSERDDLVLPEGQTRFAFRAGDRVQLRVLKGAPHEAFNSTQEIRERHAQTMLDFLAGT